MRIVTQVRLLFWLLVVGCALGLAYEGAKASGLIRPEPRWEQRCLAYRTDKVREKRQVGNQWMWVETHRPTCIDIKTICVVPKGARRTTCKGAA